MLEWYDFVRLATAVTALITMYILWRTYFLNRGHFTIRVMDYWWTLNLFLFASFFASIESIALDRGPSKTVWIFLVASLIALRATRNGRISEMDQVRADNRSIPRALLHALWVFLTRKH